MRKTIKYLCCLFIIMGLALAGEPSLAKESAVNPIQIGEITQVTATASSGEYYDTVEDAAVYMREQLKARVSPVVIPFQTTEAPDGSVLREIYNLAIEHTGVPDEGDYIAFQTGGWSANLSGSYNGTVYFLEFTYDIEYYTSAEQEADVTAAVRGILNALDISGRSDFARTKAVYDYICSHVTYDYDHLGDSEYMLQYTAYAACMNGTSVCQGYAVLLYRMLLEAGVDCRVISGTGNGGPHAWNIVRLDGKYYNVDVTWDASVGNYRYFLKCDENFPDHTRDAKYLSEDYYLAYPMSESDYAFNSSISWTWSGTDAAEAAFIVTDGTVRTVAADITAENLAITENGVTRAVILYTASAEGPDGTVYTDTKEVADDAFVISNSGDFSGKMAMYYYLRFPDVLLADEGLKVRLTFLGESTDILVKDVNPTHKTGEDFNRYKFSQDVFAKQMREEIVLEVFDGEGNRVAFYVRRNQEDEDGGYRTDGYRFTILDYLKLAEAGGSNKMKALAYAADYYGVATQYQFSYNTDGLEAVAEAVTAVTADDLAPYAPTESGTLPGVLSKASTNSVFFESDNTLRQFFILKSGKTLEGVTVTVKGPDGNEKTIEPVRYNETRYYVDIPNIAPKNMADAYTFKVTDGTNTYSYTISVLGYAYKAVMANTSETMTNLGKAAYLYYTAAAAYFGN